MKLFAYKCPECEYLVYSRAKQDFIWCPCENLFVDSGPSMPGSRTRFGAKRNMDKITRTEIELDVTKEELRDDWNKGKNKYGHIKPSK